MKTFATTLLDADVPNTEVAQLGGWKSIQTLNEYAVPNIKKQKSVSDILSKAFLPKVTAENNSENRYMFINTDTSNDEMNSVHENDKNESDVNSSQLIPISNCHLQNSTACMYAFDTSYRICDIIFQYDVTSFKERHKSLFPFRGQILVVV